MHKIILNKGQNLWFTSDTHYNHKNICRGVSNWGEESRTRPFSTIEEMNNAIVDNINDNVMENDFLIGLGDFSFGGYEKIPEFRSRINCKNIIWLLGNHDHHFERSQDIRKLFHKIDNYLELEVIKDEINQKFVLFHYPIASYNGLRKGVIHLHGHVHFPFDLRMGPGKMMDVGLDGHPEFRPYSLNEIISLMDERPNVSFLSLDAERYKFE